MINENAPIPGPTQVTVPERHKTSDARARERAKQREKLEDAARTKWSRQYHRAIADGARAFDRRQGVNMNPFSAESEWELHRAWQDGYEQRQKEVATKQDTPHE